MSARMKVGFHFLAVCLTLGVTDCARAEVVYREIFPTTSGDIAGTSPAIGGNWQGHAGNGGFMLTGTDWTRARLVHANGTSPGQPAVNSSHTGSENTGFLMGYQHAVDQVIFWTDEFTIDRGQWNIDTISWYQAHSDVNDKSRVALRVGADWYVSNTAFTQGVAGWYPDPANFATNAVFKQLNFSGETWRALNFVPGSSLDASLAGAAGALPIGNITAFGWYSTAAESSGWQAFDSFEISATASAVPEPNAIALGALGFGLIAILIRRAQRSSRRISALPIANG